MIYQIYKQIIISPIPQWTIKWDRNRHFMRDFVQHLGESLQEIQAMSNHCFFFHELFCASYFVTVERIDRRQPTNSAMGSPDRFGISIWMWRTPILPLISWTSPGHPEIAWRFDLKYPSFPRGGQVIGWTHLQSPKLVNARLPKLEDAHPKNLMEKHARGCAPPIEWRTDGPQTSTSGHLWTVEHWHNHGTPSYLYKKFSVNVAGCWGFRRNFNFPGPINQWWQKYAAWKSSATPAWSFGGEISFSTWIGLLTFPTLSAGRVLTLTMAVSLTRSVMSKQLWDSLEAGASKNRYSGVWNRKRKTKW